MIKIEGRVWIFGGPGAYKVGGDLYEWTKKGEIRFGWSGDKTRDLDDPNNPWDKWDRDMKKARRLLEIHPGDWVVRVNTPEKGLCIAAKITEGYSWDDIGYNDFGYLLKGDPDSVIEFHRNDPAVRRNINRQLKPFGRLQRLGDYLIQDFEESLNAVIAKQEGKDVDTDYLRKDVEQRQKELLPELLELLKKGAYDVQKAAPRQDLEHLLAEILNSFPEFNESARVTPDCTEQGADILADLNFSLDSVGINYKATVVIQVKSFTGKHYAAGVSQLKEALEAEAYEADIGILATTGERTQELLDALDKLAEETNKQVRLLDGAQIFLLVSSYLAKKS